MATDQPKPDRCGARVTDKLGTEITLGTDPELTFTDKSVRLCRFVDDAHDPTAVVETRANYKTLQEWLWDDYVLTAIGLDPDATLGEHTEAHGDVPTREAVRSCDAIVEVDAPRPLAGAELSGTATYQAVELETALDEIGDVTAEQLRWIETDPSAEHNVTNRYNELQGYCEEFPAHGEQYCTFHAGRQRGNPNYTEGEAKANITHGLYAQRTNYYKSLEPADKEFVEGMVSSWIDDAPFGRNNSAKVNELYRIAIDQHRAWRALDEYVEDGEFEGMTKEVTVDYDEETKEEVTAEDEHPVNLPYSRLDRDIVKKLKEIGIYGADDDTAEEAVESIATLLSSGASE